MTQSFANLQDEQYVSSIADAQKRSAIADSLSKHRRADTLEAGDQVPSLPLTRLSRGETVHLTELVGARPLMLIFGSYT
jgi:hypothetical protein